MPYAWHTTLPRTCWLDSWLFEHLPNQLWECFFRAAGGYCESFTAQSRCSPNQQPVPTVCTLQRQSALAGWCITSAAHGLCLEPYYWPLNGMKAQDFMNQFDNYLTSAPHYASLQCVLKPCDSLKSTVLQWNTFNRKIKWLAVNCTRIVVCSYVEQKHVVELAFDNIIIEEVYALCKFALLVSHQNHINLSVELLDDPVMNLYQKESTCEIQNFRSLCRPQQIFSVEGNPMPNDKRKFIGFLVQSRCLCIGLKC